jgi:hypothetical protein
MHKQLLQPLLPGALQLQLEQHQQQLLAPVPVVSLLHAALEAQCLTWQQPEQQQQQQRTAVTGGTAAEKALNIPLSQVLLELLLLQPQDVQLAHHVLALAAAVLESGLMGEHTSGELVLMVFLDRLGLQLLQLLNSSSSSESDDNIKLRRAFGRLVVVLTDPGEA